jgi:effector-binding domain-containing protein
MNKALKISGIVVGSLAVIGLVPPLLMPPSYTASSSIVIESNPYNVFPYVADLKNWEKWSPWAEQDPNMAYVYSENTYGAGASMQWDSKIEQMGAGKMTTLQFKKFHHIYYRWDFMKPFKNVTNGQVIIEKINDHQVKVTWNNTGKLKWPVDRWVNTFTSFKKMFEKDFAHGLENLKKLVESSPQRQLPVVKAEEMEVPEQLIYSVMHETVLNSEVGAKIGESYQAILQAIASTQAIPVEAPPLCLFYSHNNKTTKMRPGMVVMGCGSMPNGVECIPMRAGKVLRFAYLGGYTQMEPTYDAINVYLEENKIKKRENYTWESYITDPGLEPDSTKWLTYIYVPIK